MRRRDDSQIRQLVEDERAAMFQEERDQLRGIARGRIEEIQTRNKETFNKRRKKAIERTHGGPGLKLH